MKTLLNATNMVCMHIHMLSHLLAHSFIQHLLCAKKRSHVQPHKLCIAQLEAGDSGEGYCSHRPQCECLKLFRQEALQDFVSGLGTE